MIPLNDAARSLLESHPRTESPYIFPGRNGGQLQTIRKPANRIKIAAGLPHDFRAMHGLRHVYASMLASRYTLQKLLTHKDSKMTQRYAHLRDDAMKRAADVAGSIIDRIANGAADKADVVDMGNRD